MRSCPSCARSYPATQEFCTEDGTPLNAVATVPEGPPIFTNREFPPPADAAPLPAGTQVGEYVVEKQIGEGGMGVIFSGVHPLIGKQVAIKVLNPQMAHNPDVVARFIQEAKSVNQIRHRNIVDIFSFGTLGDGRHYFVMEFLDGEPLSSRLKQGPMAEAEALSVLLQTTSALEAAHAKGIVHRDLKPDNLFISSSAEGPFVKVLDFGIAKLLGDTGGMTKTSTGMPMGTPLYMSPEQAAGGKVDHRTDLYALGIILYEMVTGRPPFDGNTVIAVLSAQLNDPPPPIESAAEVHPELKLLIEQLLAKEPAERPPSMTEVRERIAALKELHASGATLWQRKSGGQTRTVKRARKTTPPILALSLGAVAALGVAVVGLKASHKPAPAPVPVAVPAPPPPPAAPTTGRIVISTNALGTKVFLDEPKPDGTTTRASTPAAAGGMNLKLQVPAARDLVLRVEADGYRTVSMPIKVNAGDEVALPVVLVADAPPPTTPSPAPTGSRKSAHAGKKPDGKPGDAPAKQATGDKAAQNENLMNPF